jgi:hypothetical protein
VPQEKIIWSTVLAGLGAVHFRNAVVISTPQGGRGFGAHGELKSDQEIGKWNTAENIGDLIAAGTHAFDEVQEFVFLRGSSQAVASAL